MIKLEVSRKQSHNIVAAIEILIDGISDSQLKDEYKNLSRIITKQIIEQVGQAENESDKTK